MADKQITQLSATTSPLASGDLIVIEKADGSGTKKMTYNEFIKAVSATMLTQSGAVTDSLHAVNARELNATISGTVAAKISTLNSSTVITGLPSTITDLNDLKTTSVYGIHGTLPANVPITVANNTMPTWGSYIFTYRLPGNEVYLQIFVGQQANWQAIFTRRCINGEWSDWFQYQSVRANMGSDDQTLHYDIVTDADLKSALSDMTQKTKTMEFRNAVIRAQDYTGSIIQSGTYTCLVSKATSPLSTSNFSTVLFYAYSRSKLYLFRNNNDTSGNMSIVEFNGTSIATW